MIDKPTGVLIVTILFAIGGILSILGGVGILFAQLFIGSMVGISEYIYSGMAIYGAIGVILLIVGIIGLAVAYGIWNMKRWAKTVGIILAVISLINFSIETLWE